MQDPLIQKYETSVRELMLIQRIRSQNTDELRITLECGHTFSSSVTAPIAAKMFCYECFKEKL